MRLKRSMSNTLAATIDEHHAILLYSTQGRRTTTRLPKTRRQLGAFLHPHGFVPFLLSKMHLFLRPQTHFPSTSCSANKCTDFQLSAV
jgi:hypothetical protein